jgi:hypothetical protein
MTGFTSVANRGLGMARAFQRLTTRATVSVLVVALFVSAPSTHAVAAEQYLPVPDLGSCRLRLPRDLTTIAYYTYGGSTTSKYRLFYEPQTHLARQPVVIPKRDRPLFVVLVSYGPTEWDLRIEPEAEIAGVLVLGYRDQIISNLPKATSLGFSIFSGGHGQDCPTKSTWWGDESLMKVLPPMLDFEFSHAPNEFYSSAFQDCRYFLCERNGLVADKPKPSFWNRIFSRAAPAEVASRTDPLVRTSARLIVR